MTSKKDTPTATAENIDPLGIKRRLKCGLIMPISKSQGLEPEHWLNVKSIICEALIDTGLEVRLVSESDDVGVIHKSIVQNIYQNDIVICDVSTHNANVMFELGLRLAFDKPTVIIKDDETPFSFDTQVIEHIVYKRSLHYIDIISFKKKLKDKVEATLAQAQDPDFSTFLRHFTISHVARIEERTVSVNDAVMERLEQMQSTINFIFQQQPQKQFKDVWDRNKDFDITIPTALRSNVKMFLHSIASAKNMDVDGVIRYINAMSKEEFNDLIPQYYKILSSSGSKLAPHPPGMVRDEILKLISNEKS
jgi:hypothetical protein